MKVDVRFSKNILGWGFIWFSVCTYRWGIEIILLNVMLNIEIIEGE